MSVCVCEWVIKKVDENVLSLQNKTVPSNLTFSPDGKLFAAVGQDRKVSSNQLIPTAYAVFSTLVSSAATVEYKS